MADAGATKEELAELDETGSAGSLAARRSERLRIIAGGHSFGAR
jgi:hypothetical protein